MSNVKPYEPWQRPCLKLCTVSKLCRTVSKCKTCRTVSKRVEPCQNVSKRVKPCRNVSTGVETCQTVSNRVKTCQNVSKRVKTCRNVSKRVETRNVSKRVKTCRNVSKRVETCRNVSKRVKTCRNVSKRVENSKRVKTCRTVSITCRKRVKPKRVEHVINTLVVLYIYIRCAVVEACQTLSTCICELKASCQTVCSIYIYICIYTWLQCKPPSLTHDFDPSQGTRIRCSKRQALLVAADSLG